MQATTLTGIRKRNGDTVPLDRGRIEKALWRCFNSIGYAPAPGAVVAVTDAVLNVLAGAGTAVPGVEDVQRAVIQQLWGRGLFTAAEHYQNYREEHRKARIAAAVSPEAMARTAADQQHLRTDLQYYQFMSKFSRWREAEGRRETWREAVFERVCPWLFRLADGFGGGLTPLEKADLSTTMFNLEASPAMRVVQMAGPALDRCHVGAYNCAYAPLQDVFGFPELLYILMQGTGDGFSVEGEYVSELPRVRRSRGISTPETIAVPDTTEGWCDSYHRLLQLLWDGHDGYLDVSGVRRKGVRLKIKGGRSSGPDPLLELAAFARSRIKARQGQFLTDLDAHDLACMTGRIVQVGGVRRAALIGLSDLDSVVMRHAKSGPWWEANRQRSMANNSAVYDYEVDVPVEVFMEEWLALVKSQSGERGIFNRRAAERWKPARRQSARWGCNPCAEIILRPFEFCNLSIAVARPDDTVASLVRKVRIAALFGKIQSLATRFNYIRPDWANNCNEERLLGVDITGHADCPLLRFDTPGRAELLRMLNRVVAEVDATYSRRFGVNPSAANTTVKPGGDSAIFFDCASGVSPRFARRQIRWVREQKDTPVAQYLMDAGVPYADAPEAPGELMVFGFPKTAPEGCTLRNDMTAEQQFRNWLEWKQNWAEHSVSATIYVEPHEWPSLGGLVYENINHITGLAFLPKDNGSYTYPPNEELTEEGYAAFAARFPADLNWAKLSEYETEDTTGGRATFACVGPDGCM